jgi:phosphopantothenoylcysteine decarboxylase/phosphopantothenate--cysteine ligase
MGYAIAAVAAQRGANVTLISGPVHLAVPQGVTCINVESAAEMQKIALAEAVSNDIFIGVAAVTDYRPVQAANRKIKKTENVGGLVLQLVECVDVIASVAHLTENRPFTVGFAAETDNIEQYAQKKLVDKNLDLICANDISKSNQGFTSDTNALHLFWKDGDKILPLNQKNLLADQLITEIIAQYRNTLN